MIKILEQNTLTVQ